jgi:hypothetical protein
MRRTDCSHNEITAMGYEGTGNFWDSDVFLHILFLDDHNFINNRAICYNLR